MAQTVVGLFERREAAERAVERLLGKGIGREQVDLAAGHIENVSGTNDGRSDGTRGTDGVTGFFNSLFGVDSDESRRHATVATNKRCSIVTVHARSNDQAEDAADILDDCGALDVSENAREIGSGARQSVSGGTQAPGATGASGGRETTIPRVEEHLEVGKRVEERGSVRVRSRIVEKPVEQHVRLREEHVHVERQAVDRPVSDAERANLRSHDIELTERAEVPVVSKEARVVEEVRVSKEATERDQTIRDTVRHTEVDVDRVNTGRNDTSSDNSTSRLP
jgi:stress response protein YsnF